eukprot:16689-Heterococcus_DN1.PRE.13
MYCASVHEIASAVEGATQTFMRNLQCLRIVACACAYRASSSLTSRTMHSCTTACTYGAINSS